MTILNHPLIIDLFFRIGICLTFVGHGYYALNVKQEWIPLVSKSASNLVVRLYDISGKLIFEQRNLKTNSNSEYIKIYTANLDSGTYNLVVDSGTNQTKPDIKSLNVNLKSITYKKRPL